jgi:hypothetical protein
VAYRTKSTKSKKGCVNPVFESWLEELRGDAVARDLQSKHTYTKVLDFILIDLPLRRENSMLSSA